ncbi:hypothetical protein [Segniliparus rotundus]|uniref:hypothetical protein n=1 Tax=Segniliparus rotundus TaxID=286802 RepID=UPI0011D178E0|nr:hypothetical protein [Segniliparus rotundus]
MSKLLTSFLAVSGLIVCLGGCDYPDRRSEANSVGATVRALPGVASADVRYDTSFDGGAHFDLDVKLADNASAAQAAAMGRVFVDRMRASELDQFDVTLNVQYRFTSSTANEPARGSSATLKFNERANPPNGPSGAETSDSLALWLTVAQSPFFFGVGMTQPTFEGPDSSRDMFIELPFDTDDATISDFIHEHPGLDTATWVTTIPDWEAGLRPAAYKLRGEFPDKHRRELWKKLLKQLGASDKIDLEIDAIKAPAGRAPVYLEIIDHSSKEKVPQVARSVAAAALGFGDIVDLRFGSEYGRIELVEGVCEQPQPSKLLADLENELRQQYKHC